METDHSSLKQIEPRSNLRSSKRLARWAEDSRGRVPVVWIAGKTNLIRDGISRSLSAEEGTPVTQCNTNLPRVSGISSYVDDSRMEKLNYSQSKEFKIPFELLDPASTV